MLDLEAVLSEIVGRLSAPSHADRAPLLLIAGPSGSGKTRVLRALQARHGYRYVNLSLELSGRLRRCERGRFLAARDEALALLRPQLGSPIGIDHIEVLFHPLLRLDPLAFLHDLCREGAVVAAWPGEYDGARLTYAVPGHPEYVDVPAENLHGCQIIRLEGQGCATQI